MIGAAYGAAYAALYKAKGAHRRLLLEHGAKLTRATELDTIAREAEGAAAFAEAEQLAGEAQALAEGRELDGRRSADSERVTKAAKRRARAAEAAAQTVRNEAASMAPQIEASETAVTNAALGAMRGLRDGGAGKFIALLAVEPLAEIVASDEIRRALIGDAYTFDVRQHPTETLWSGSAAVRKLIDNLPVQLLPAGFKAEVESTARRVTAEVLAALNAEADR